MRNLELKVRCGDSSKLSLVEKRAQQAQASYLRTMRQRDTYFCVSEGRLKLREWWHVDGGQKEPQAASLSTAVDQLLVKAINEATPVGATLIAYARPDQDGSRLSNYYLSPVADASSLSIVLQKALGILIVVEKIRKLYEYQHTRIHLDIVNGLGSFVELETVMQQTTPLIDAEAEHQRVIQLLELHTFSPIASSYIDLLLISS